MPRPDRLIVVTGTGTEVGKTWVTAGVSRRLRAGGVEVAARKPVQSFTLADTATDAAVLGEATGAPADTVCPPHRWYPVALAPPMAADALGLAPILLDDLVAELDWPAGVDVGFVEGAGGLCSPIAHDGDTLALARRVGPDLVLVVAEPVLGVVSQVRLAARALAGFEVLVVLNRYDPSDEVHRRSRDWLATNDSLAVVTGADLTGAGDLDFDVILRALNGGRPVAGGP
jgi:dethiobiotin synthetase